MIIFGDYKSIQKLIAIEICWITSFGTTLRVSLHFEITALPDALPSRSEENTSVIFRIVGRKLVKSEQRRQEPEIAAIAVVLREEFKYLQPPHVRSI